MIYPVFSINIETETVNNENYRKVLNTTKNQQLVVMNLKPLEDIPMEIHKDHDQFIRIEEGNAEAEYINNSETLKIKLTSGSAIMIPAGTPHHIINISSTDNLKLYSIYSPPEHDENRIDINKPQDESRTLKNLKIKCPKWLNITQVATLQTMFNSMKSEYMLYKKNKLKLNFI